MAKLGCCSLQFEVPFKTALVFTNQRISNSMMILATLGNEDNLMDVLIMLFVMSNGSMPFQML